MQLAADIPGLTDATLPLLGTRGATVYLVTGCLLGAVVALSAQLAYRDRCDEAWRQLRFLGLVLVPTFLVRALLSGDELTSRPLLAAAFSLLDLALLGLATQACLRLFAGDQRYGAKMTLLAPMMAAVFLGVLGGDGQQPLLSRNALAAGSHLLALAGLVALTLWELVRDLRLRLDQARAQTSLLEAEKESLADDLARIRAEYEEGEERAARAAELARDAGRRARLLEHLIASAVELHGRRGHRDLFDHAAELVGELFGFGRVVIYQWSESLAAFAAQAAHGGPDGPGEGVAHDHVDRADYDRLVHPRFRVSNSYLVPPPTAATWPPPIPADEAAWLEGQRLLVPITDAAGLVRGFLALYAPESGRAPDLLRIRYLELLARQLASVLEGGELRERLAACRAELAVADERLQALGELRSNFIANVSHELRTPLTSIIGYSEMMRERDGDMSPEMRREFLEVIHEQGQQLKDIINDLLDLESVEDRSTRQDRTECDLSALVRRLAEDWRQQAAAGDLDFRLEGADRELVLEADPVLCQQLMGHLVDNALKFTRAGGRVLVRLSEQGTAARLEVQDTGIGIPDDKLHTIFEQFYQVDGSNTREVGGQGVGLSICQDIVSWHDGRIWAENVPAGGTRFTVLLPRRPQVVVPDPPAPLNPVFHDPRLFLQRLVHWVSENLGVCSAVILRADAQRAHLQVVAAAGVPAGQLQGLRLARGVGLAGRTWHEGQSRCEVPDAGDVLLTGGGPVLCVPLPEEGEVLGVIAIRERIDGRPFTDDDRLLLEAMAPRLVDLMARFDGQEDIQRDFAAVQASLRATTRVGTLDHADVAGVCQEICLATARRLGLPDAEIRHLAFALRYYDVGLGSVPPHLLHKADALTDAERAQLERHVQAGLVTLAPLKPPPKVRQIILHHHENYDGSGYPKGLAGEAIPLGSRLVALTDSLRALLQRRPWRPAVPLSDALAEIQAFAGTRYCPRVAAVFLEEAETRRRLIEDLRQRADDGEDLRRPAPAVPASLPRDV